MIKKKKLKVGIVGCGAIGSRIAHSIQNELKTCCVLSGLYDIDLNKTKKLAADISAKKAIKKSLPELIKNCDLMVEAVASDETKNIVRAAIKARKNVLAMSIGKLLDAENLFALADKNNCTILLPSGAVSGLDAIKAASLKNIFGITLTTRKPPAGFARSRYVIEKGIDLSQIRCEAIIFDGSVNEAVRLFPENINVAATLALASKAKEKIRIRIITSPEFKTNSHEIEMTGDFGKMTSRTDNVVCPDNPKTSYLAVLSAIQTLKQFFSNIKIGT